MQIVFFLISFLSSAEVKTTEPKIIEKPPFPSKLSMWNLFLKESDRLFLNERVIPYELTSALFTDYAEKFRTIWIPKDKKISYQKDGTLNYPIGTLISKTFAYKKDELVFLEKDLDPKQTKLATYLGPK